MPKIAFYHQGTPCNGESIYSQALGGTESALIYAARALAKAGHEVHVFNSTDEPGLFDSVYYHSVKQFESMTEEEGLWDVFFSVRALLPLMAKRWGKLQVLFSPDAHDQPFLNQAFSIAIDQGDHRVQAGLYSLHDIQDCLDLVFCVGNWQAETFFHKFKIPIEKLYVAGNGVDLKVFKKGLDLQERKASLIYLSTPFRGLEYLLQVFPRIKAQVPEAELKVLSGMQLYGMSDDQDATQYEHVYKMAQQEGVELLKPMGKKEMAQLLAESKILAYPNSFAETFCIAALEAQACGVPVVSSKLGSMPERVQDGEDGFLIEGHPSSQQYQDEFVERCVRLLKNDELWTEMSELSWQKAQSFDYDLLVSYWLKHLSTFPLPELDHETPHFIPDGKNLDILVKGYPKHIELSKGFVTKYYLEALKEFGLKNIAGKLKKHLLG